jgi:biotin-dependent carboxylase-like uncharacterized protein
MINTGWLSLVVDSGRYGFADIGVPSSSSLDCYAFHAVNYLTGNPVDAPAIEVVGGEFALRTDVGITCAITGAKVIASNDGVPVKPWTPFKAKKGSIIEIKEVVEGFRYYVGFSGIMALEKVIGSYSTNIECRFGGFSGRPLMGGDIIQFCDVKTGEGRVLQDEYIPSMNPPHILRVIEGPEMDYFTRDSIKRFYERQKGPPFTVSARINRTGIRLDGRPLIFRGGAEKSIISEGILPGTIQIPGDGVPIIMLHERTIGGYARIAMVAKADLDLLAHLKPKDTVLFKSVSVEEAEFLWERKQENIAFIYKN